MTRSRSPPLAFLPVGHLVASLGTLLPKAQRPNALVLGYAATLGAMWTVAGRQEPDLHALVDDDTPPTFLFATQGDALVPVKNSLVFADALADHGIPFALHLFPTGAHGISLATACTSGPEASRVNPATAQWLPMSVDFLQKLWGCLGVTGTGYRACRPACRRAAQPEYAGAQVDEEPAGQRSAAGCAGGYVAGHCV